AEVDFNADDSPPADETPRDYDSKELVIDSTNSNAEDFDRLEALNKDWENSFNEDHRPSRNGMDEEGDKKHDAMQNMASRPQSLQDYLGEQLSFLDVPSDQLGLVRYLISHIDENGRLSLSLEELAQNHQPPVTPAELE